LVLDKDLNIVQSGDNQTHYLEQTIIWSDLGKMKPPEEGKEQESDSASRLPMVTRNDSNRDRKTNCNASDTNACRIHGPL